MTIIKFNEELVFFSNVFPVPDKTLVVLKDVDFVPLIVYCHQVD